MTKKRHSQLTLNQKRIAFDAIDFCVDKFLSRQKREITIKVQGVENLLQKENIYADCDYEENENDGTPVEFLIRIDNTLDLETFLRSMMHELVHMKQWCKGEMKQLIRGCKTMTYKWHSQKIKLNSVDYYDYPWEIEAHGREEGLTRQFFAKNPKWQEIVENETVVTDTDLQGSKQMVLPLDWSDCAVPRR
mgnify:CR=1 FL=1